MTPPPLQITCKEFAELVTAHEDGVLPERDRIRFECHRERCPGCRAYLQQFRLTIRALRSLPPETAEPDNLDELARRFKDSEPPASELGRERALRAGPCRRASRPWL